MAREYPRGSEWRKWDLHVHTPFSALHTEFGNDFERYAKTLLERAVSNGVVAVGVTDYFCIEGYKRLRALLRNEVALRSLVGEEVAEAAADLLLLPNIELRTSIIVARPGGGDSRVNFHVIFSDEMEPDVVEEHFLRGLHFTAESWPDHPDERWSLTESNLKELGKKLKGQHEEFRSRGDLFVGMMQAVVSHEEVTAVLSGQRSRFKDRFLLVVSADEDLSECSWDGQAHLARKLLIQKSHMLFSSNPGTREFGLGLRHMTVADFRREFGDLKPCVHGSDAHGYDSLFEPTQGRHLWIKADPTFHGLRQLVHEPESRVFIGDEPRALTHARQNATKFMTQIQFSRTASAGAEAKWFSGVLPLNAGLIAIIGSKGSGKSALADILALLGNTGAARHFAFLRPDRFLAPKTRLGAMFRAAVRWLSGQEIAQLLGDQVDSTAPELVKYIPQNYLEAICGELGESTDTEFDRELQGVIFSHVTEAERLGTQTLRQLISYVTQERQARIALLVKELAVLNGEVIAAEDEVTEEHRRRLEAQLAQRQSELVAHDAARPVPVNEPSKDPQAEEAAAAVARELAILQTRLDELDAALTSQRERLARSALQVTAADRLLSRMDNLERQLRSFTTESASDAEVLGLDLSQLVALRVDREPVRQARTTALMDNETSKSALDAERTDSLAAQRASVLTHVDAKKSELDEPARRYEEYRRQLSQWEARRADIEGAPEKAFSVKGLEGALAALDDAPDRLEARRQARGRVVREIFEAKEQLLDDYRRLYAPVQEFIDRHPVSKDSGALAFSASIAVDGLVDGLLEMIHQGRRGSFQGESEGRDRLRQLVLLADFQTFEGVENFLRGVQEHLESDKGDTTEPRVRLVEQLRQAFSPQEVYAFLYGLQYLKPRFELRWYGKSLDQLSPGERGNLLLVFYLLIDRRDVPLVIDQPEENLDNQTVATTLVPALRYAKNRRQIVMVTHNPNLAVVCDADQVIHTQIDKTDGNRVTYTCGSLENPTITQLVVDVLEGTKPAFDLRDARYEVLETVPD